MDRKHHRTGAKFAAPVGSWALLALLTAAGGGSFPAHAASPEGIQRQLSAVARLYEDLEYEDALETIQSARAMPHSQKEEVALLLYEGILLLETGRAAEGRTAFVSALVLDGDARLPVKVAPKIQSVFDEARAQAAPVERPVQERDVPLREAPPPAPRVQVAPPPPLAPELGKAEGPVTLRSYSLIPALAGGGLLVASGVCWSFSRQELGRLRGGPDGYGTQEEAREGAARGRAWQMAGVGLLGAGLVGLGAATAMYVWGGPQPAVALGVGNNGVSAFVSGEWP